MIALGKLYQQGHPTRACSTTACGAANRWHFTNHFPAPLTAAADAQAVGPLSASKAAARHNKQLSTDKSWYILVKTLSAQ